MQLTSRVGRVFQLDGLLLAILIGSLGMNVYMGVVHNRPGTGAPSRAQLLAAGSKAPAFEGSDLNGTHVSLTYNANKAGTLLYVFSPSCHWCERNRANIAAIAKTRPDLRVIGVSLGPTLDAQAAARQPFAQILRPTPTTSMAYHLTGTPTTILISPAGKVLNAWSGAYAGPVANDISKVLAVTLPGLMEDLSGSSGTSR